MSAAIPIHGPAVGVISWSPDFKSGSTSQVMSQPIVLPPNMLLISRAELDQLRDALSKAMEDIRQYVHIAEYNLTGKCGQDQMEIPNPPQMVHRVGIEESQRILEQARLAWLVAHGKLNPDRKKL